MNQQRMLDRLPQVLQHAWVHFQARQGEARQPPDWTIAISREAGIESTSVAHEVGTLLAWPVYDHELLERLSAEMGLRPALLERVDEKPVRWLVERLQTFLVRPAVSETAYIEHLISTLLSLAVHGRCVVVGRGANHLLPPEATLRVRLMAPLAHRIEAVRHTLNLTAAEAARRVDMIDRERCDFVKQHFHQDATNAHHYDLILNCARFSVAECAEVIVNTLHRFQARKAHLEPVEAGVE